MRYVGTKGTKMLSGIDLNQGNITTNGFLDAFNVTRAGGNAPLFDQLFAGLTVPGKGVVDGVTVRGSDYARSNATFASYLADGRVGTLLNNLNSSALLTNVNGGLLRRAGLPENFFFTNPQFATVYLVGNNANSTYHSLQVEVRKALRPRLGLPGQLHVEQGARRKRRHRAGLRQRLTATPRTCTPISA